MPTGTPLLAPTRCRVVHIGGSIIPATGRFVTLDDGTRWIRFLHLKDWVARPGDELEPGDLVAISGASGYGSEFFGEPNRNAAFWRNTGGDHVHVTAFRGRAYTFGSTGTVDFHAMTGGVVAGGGSTSFEEDDMFTDQDRMRLESAFAALFGPASIGAATPLKWKNLDGSAQSVNYGLLPLVIHNQNLIAKQAGQIAGITTALQALKAGGVDMAAVIAAVTDAAEKGAREALGDLKVTIEGAP